MSEYIRPEVMAFATLMENKLRENDHKGGWKRDTVEALTSRASDELEELERVVGAYGSRTYNNTATDGMIKSIGDECADVANFCMMVADNYGSLDVLRCPDGVK